MSRCYIYPHIQRGTFCKIIQQTAYIHTGVHRHTHMQSSTDLTMEPINEVVSQRKDLRTIAIKPFTPGSHNSSRAQWGLQMTIRIHLPHVQQRQRCTVCHSEMCTWWKQARPYMAFITPFMTFINDNYPLSVTGTFSYVYMFRKLFKHKQHQRCPCPVLAPCIAVLRMLFPLQGSSR